MDEPLPNTPTGLPIGFRRARTPWQQDLPTLLSFAREAGFSFLDFGPIDAATATAVLQQKISIGTIDLLDWTGLVSSNADQRAAAILVNASHVRSHVGLGTHRFLAVLTPAEPERPRRENFGFAVEAYRSLAKAAEECGASIVLEGAPGRPPHFPNLGCTPADLRAFFEAVASPAVGLNYDPSHLVRMGIDPIRFLREFASRVGHVHAKDTTFLPIEQYEHGSLQQATFDEPHVYGGFGWRYALPGKGAVPWRELLQTLNEIGYRGGISIELEDEAYLGSEAGEKAGLLEAARFLQGPM